MIYFVSWSTLKGQDLAQTLALNTWNNVKTLHLDYKGAQWDFNHFSLYQIKPHL